MIHLKAINHIFFLPIILGLLSHFQCFIVKKNIFAVKESALLQVLAYILNKFLHILEPQ